MAIVKKLHQQIDMSIMVDGMGDLLLIDEDGEVQFRIDADYVWIFVGKTIEALEQFDSLQEAKTKAH